MADSADGKIDYKASYFAAIKIKEEQQKQIAKLEKVVSAAKALSENKRGWTKVTYLADIEFWDSLFEALAELGESDE